MTVVVVMVARYWRVEIREAILSMSSAQLARIRLKEASMGRVSV